MPRRAPLALAVLLAGGVVAGCGGSSAPTAAPQPPAPTLTPPACPTPSKLPPAHWPRQVPKDLPKPANAKIDESQTAADGVHIVKFTTPTTLRDAVLFVVDRLPKAGYVLGRGDAEANEADAPFQHGNIRGLMRMVDLGNCQTQWLLATVDVTAPANGSPLLPAHTPSGSPSPLPFG